MPLIAWAALAALAHDSVGPIAVRPLFDDAGLVGAWTTWGLVLREGAGWWRVCEEAHGGARDAFVDLEGRVWLARPDGLRRTTDAGCSVGDPVIDAPIASLTPLGEDLLVVADGFPGDALWRLEGEAAVALPALPVDTDVRSAALGGDGAWWLAGVAAGAPVLWRSADPGGSWAPIPVPDPTWLAVAVHGPPTAGGGVVVSGLTTAGTAPLWVVEEADAGRLGELPLALSGYGCAGGWCFAALAQTTLVRWDPSAGLTETLETVAGGPARCLWEHEGALWGCTDVTEDPHLRWTTDGEVWQDEMVRWGVLDRACPEGTPGEAMCALPGQDTGGPVDTGPAGPPIEVEPRCGCASVAGGGPLGWVGVLWLARRRRRYSSRQAR